MIKALLFDFGDVFLNLDKPATFRELEKLGITGFTDEMLRWNIKYEVGELDSETFISNYQQPFPQVSREKLIAVWNAILQDFPQHRLEFLRTLKHENKYKLILLSNTNEIHIQWVMENIPQFEEFKECFDAFYLSHEIQLRKPDTAVFQYILNQHKLKPGEVVFIDDTKEHTDAAKKLGFHVWNIDPATEDITELFEHKIFQL